MRKRPRAISRGESACALEQVDQRLTVHVCRNTEDRAQARLLHPLRTEQGMKMAMAAIPAPMIGAGQPVGLDLGVQGYSRVVHALATDPQETKLEFVILDRPDAVLDALKIGREVTDEVEYRAAEGDVGANQTDGIRRRDLEPPVTVIDQGERRPAFASQPRRRRRWPQWQHAATDEIGAR